MLEKWQYCCSSSHEMVCSLAALCDRECTRGGFCNFMHLKPISRDLRRKLYGGRKKYVTSFCSMLKWKLLALCNGLINSCYIYCWMSLCAYDSVQYMTLQKYVLIDLYNNICTIVQILRWPDDTQLTNDFFSLHLNTATELLAKSDASGEFCDWLFFYIFHD